MAENTENAGKSDKWEKAEKAYSDAFLAELSAKFNFDARAPKIAQEIRVIGRRYLADAALDDDDGALRAKSRKEYRALKKQVANFAEFLSRPEYADISSDIYFAALRAGAEPPKTDFPQLTKFEKTRGAPYLAELIRLLRLLDAAADEGIKSSSPPRGRKKKCAVENFARRSAWLWTDMLGRPFTIDYHKGAGLTSAFEFVKALLGQLDPEISDKSIITAMRSAIAQNRKLELRERKTIT